MVTGSKNNVHHAAIVGPNLIAFFIELVRLGADRLGKWHQLRHSLITVVPLAVADVEVPKVRQGAAAGQVNDLHHAGEPGTVGRQAPVILHDHVQAKLGPVLRQTAQPVGGQLLFLLKTAVAGSGGVHPDGMAAEKLGRVGPFTMVQHRLITLGSAPVTKRSFAVDHDQQALYPMISRARFQLAKVGFVVGLVLEELVHVLDSIKVELLLRDLGKIERV